MLNRFSALIASMRGFAGEVGVEVKKTSWPSRDELVESTVVVIVSLILTSVFVAVCDKVLLSLVKWLM